jgi:hypothetical protein
VVDALGLEEHGLLAIPDAIDDADIVRDEHAVRRLVVAVDDDLFAAALLVAFDDRLLAQQSGRAIEPQGLGRLRGVEAPLNAVELRGVAIGVGVSRSRPSPPRLQPVLPS